MVGHLADNPTMHSIRMRTLVTIVGAVTTIAVGVSFVVRRTREHDQHCSRLWLGSVTELPER